MAWAIPRAGHHTSDPTMAGVEHPCEDCAAEGTENSGSFANHELCLGDLKLALEAVRCGATHWLHWAPIIFQSPVCNRIQAACCIRITEYLPQLQ